MTKFLKPAEGRTVDQPDGSPWPAEGMDAPNTLYVRRRINDGDLIEVDRPLPPQPEPPPPDPQPKPSPQPETPQVPKKTRAKTTGEN